MSTTHQAFVPVSQIDPQLLPSLDKQNYLPEYDEKGVFTGFGKPGKDTYVRGFVCDVDDATGAVVKTRYDALKKFDGLVGADGHATPSAVMVVCERRFDGLYLYAAPEKRIFIYDHIAKIQGPVVDTFAGGFTQKDKSPAETALDEVLEEMGIAVKSASIVRIGHASDNRAMTDTCIEYYIGVFERQVSANLGDDEMIGKARPVRVDRFVPGVDGIVNTAYAFLVHNQNLVKAGNWFDRLINWIFS